MQKHIIGDIDSYINALAPEPARIMTELYQLVKRIAPDSKESISYQMPKFQIGKHYIFIGAFKEHIGIYPPIRNNPALSQILLPYANKKGNLAFKFKDPLPLDIIERVIRFALFGAD